MNQIHSTFENYSVLLMTMRIIYKTGLLKTISSFTYVHIPQNSSCPPAKDPLSRVQVEGLKQKINLKYEAEKKNLKWHPNSPIHTQSSSSNVLFCKLILLLLLLLLLNEITGRALSRAPISVRVLAKMRGKEKKREKIIRDIERDVVARERREERYKRTTK